jgi:phage shock protein C
MKRLMRIPAGGRVAGVCAGIAHYFDVDVTLVRAAWLVLSIVPGAIVGGVLAYAAAWIVMPPAAIAVVPDNGRRRLTRSRIDRQVAGVCGGIAEYAGLDATVVRVVVAILAIYPGAIVGGVIAYAVAWLILPADPRIEPIVSPA